MLITYVTSPPHSRPTPADSLQSWEHYSSVRNNAGPHTGEPVVTVIPRQTSLRKRPSPSLSLDGEDEDDLPRARKRRSPMPLFDSDSTPECTESSSDESNGPISSQTQLEIPDPEHGTKPQKLTIKLRGLRTTDNAEPLTAIPPSIMTNTSLPSPPLSVSTPEPKVDTDCPPTTSCLPATAA